MNAVRSSTEGLAPVAIEYFNHNALDLFRKQKEDNATFRDIPSLKPDFHTAIYVECQGEAKKELSERILRIGEILQTLGEKRRGHMGGGQCHRFGKIDSSSGMPFRRASTCSSANARKQT